MNTDKVTAEQEARLKQCIEQMLGGNIVSMTRQVRWRPSWYVDVKVDDEVHKLYVRGDRQSDVVPFPDLKREADIIRVLCEHGIPAPKIYGMCEDPVAIIMEAVPGTRDVSEAESDAVRKDVARQYMEALVAMHQLPMEPFAAIGLEVPQGAEAVSLAGLSAYLPLYLKHKATAQPFLEFAMKWLRANVPAHRTKPGFIAFDAGQFLFENGTITALYDFEFAMIGDPMADIATMAMRHSHEPMGEDIDVLCRWYEEYSGAPVDHKVVRYQHALFATVACMQFVGVIDNPKPGDPHDVYLEWTLALRRSLINALAACMGVELEAPPAIDRSSAGKNEHLFKMLADANHGIPVVDELATANRQACARIIEYAQAVDRFGPTLESLALEEAKPFVGACRDQRELDSKLEAYVLSASADSSEALLRYFSNQIQRQVDAYGSTGIGTSAAHIKLESLG